MTKAPSMHSLFPTWFPEDPQEQDTSASTADKAEYEETLQQDPPQGMSAEDAAHFGQVGPTVQPEPDTSTGYSDDEFEQAEARADAREAKQEDALGDLLFEQWETKVDSYESIMSGEGKSQWIIRQKMLLGGNARMYGPSASGKSLFAVDLAMSLAAGLKGCALGKFHAPDIHEPQHVVYVALEGGPVHSGYMRAWHESHPEVSKEHMAKYFHRIDGSKGNLVIMEEKTGSPDRRIVPNEQNYNSFVHGYLEGLIKRGQKPALVIFDTQRYLMEGIDENSNTAIGALYNQMKIDGTRLGLTMMTVHHTGKDTERGGSGASAGFSNVDTDIEVKSSSTPSEKIFKWMKCKGGEHGDQHTANMIIHTDPLDVKTEWDDDEWTPMTMACVIPITKEQEILRSRTNIMEPDQEFVTRLFSVMNVNKEFGYTAKALEEAKAIRGGRYRDEDKAKIRWLVGQDYLRLDGEEKGGKYYRTEKKYGL